jgi:hypothetical protein
MTPRFPWQVPAPVAPGGFTSLRPEHAYLDVRVALDRIRPFAFGGDAAEPRLWCDLQTHPDDNQLRRLGAGRAGEYQGVYLKGVGRTALAANWADRDDLYHATGHLSVSSVLREHLVTVVLRRRGLGHTFVGVDAVLARAFSPAERDELAAHFAPAVAAVPAADRHLAGLTGKAGDFARMSNVVWVFSHLDAEVPAIGERFLAFERALTGTAGDGEPDVIAAALVAAWQRGFGYFADWFRAGVCWQCFHDNFALDGRFVDLETAVYLGAPAFAGVERTDAAAAGRVGGWIGTEVLHQVRQWRVFVRWLSARCRFLARHVVTHGGARAYLRAVATEVDAAFAATPLFDDAALRETVAAGIADPLELDTRERVLVDQIVATRVQVLLHGRPARLPDVPLVPLPWQPAQSNPTVRQRLVAPAFIAARHTPTADARGFADTITRLEALTDLDGLLAGLAEG